MKILLTNDDSHRSPLLGWAIECLKRYGDVSVVVPLHEQSWRGKALTRFGSVALSQVELVYGGVVASALDGTPADCVNIAVHHLLGHKPDLVVSGINAGLNAAECFMLSSGTVGACFEANIAGIPAIALSQAFDRETMQHYVAEYALKPEIEQHLRQQTMRLLPVVLDELIGSRSGSASKLDKSITWNVNFPATATNDTPVLAELDSGSYGSCFRRDEDSFIFELNSVKLDASPRSDTRFLREGRVTMTALRGAALGTLKVRSA